MALQLELNTRKTTLFDFTLRNEQDLNVLYILGTPGGQLLTLELTNSIGEPLDLLSPASDSTQTHHFELVFRPGTLNDDTRQAIALQDENATLRQKKNADGTVSLLLTVAAQTLAPGHKMTFRLLHVAPDGRLGSRGTRVLLRYANIQVHGSEKVIGGFRETHLSIVTHVGKAAIPLHMGVVGAGKVLNNGHTNLPVTVRVSNTSRVDNIPVGTQPASTCYLSFETGDSNETWALGTVAQVGAIQVQVRNPGAKATVDAKRLPGQTPEWEIPVPALQHGEYFDIVLNNVTTHFPAGFTSLYLRYANIPGYWDGQLVAQLEKSPVAFNHDNVGIGTLDPIARLDVLDTIGLRNANDWEHLYFDHIDNTARFAAGGAANGLVFRVGAGTSGSYNKPSQNYQEAMRLLPNGNVGIGIAKPAMRLDVLNTIGLSNTQAWNHLYLKHDDTTAYIMAGGATSGLSFQVGTGNSGSYDDAGQNYQEAMRLLPGGAVSLNGKVGVGTVTPVLQLDVHYTIGLRNLQAWNHLYLKHDGTAAHVVAGGAANGLVFKVGTGTSGSYDDAGQNYQEVMRLLPSGDVAVSGNMSIKGNVGIGISTPSYPFEVKGTIKKSYNNYGYLNNWGKENAGKVSGDSGPVDISIYAHGRILANEFGAMSDRRLKTVVGLSEVVG